MVTEPIEVDTSPVFQKLETYRDVLVAAESNLNKYKTDREVAKRNKIHGAQI